MNRKGILFILLTALLGVCGTQGSAEAQVYWADWGTAKIQKANLDGTNKQDIATGLGSPASLALDADAGKIYWTDWGTAKIQRANLDGSNTEDIVTGLVTPIGIALDVSNRKIYWTDVGMAKIQRADMDGTQIEDVVTGLGSPMGIALDVPNGNLYWTDNGTDKIQGANLDGTDKRDIITGLQNPTDIALDAVNGQLYWTDAEAGKVQCANLDGTGKRDIATGLGNPTGIALDAVNGQLYWTDGDTGKIQSAGLDDRRKQDIITGLGNLFGIAVNIPIGAPPEDQKPDLGGIVPITGDVTIDVTWGGTVTTKLDLPDLPDLVVGSPWVSDNTVAPGESFTLSVVLINNSTAESPATTLRYYRSDDNTISRSDTEIGAESVDGAGLPTAFIRPFGVTDPNYTLGKKNLTVTAPKTPGTYYYGVCVDSIENESNTDNNCSTADSITVQLPSVVLPLKLPIYWTVPGLKRIQRSNLDGANIEDLVTGLEHPNGIALDISGGKMYWTDGGAAKIQCSNLDGTNIEDIVVTGLEHPSGIALDISGGKIYWTDSWTERVQRSNLDGTNIEDLVTGFAHIYQARYVTPYSLALDISDGKMYWTDSWTDKIRRANLDGTNIEDLITNLSGPRGIALDISGGKMYWTDSWTDKIRRSNLDGTNVEDIATGLGSIFGVAVDLSGGSGGTTSEDALPSSVLQGHTAAVKSVAFNDYSDGSILVSGSADKTIRVWDTATGQVVDTLSGHAADVNSVILVSSETGEVVLSGSSDRTIRVWDTATGQIITLSEHADSVLSVVLGNGFIVSGSADKTIRLWSLWNEMDEPISIILKEHRDSVLSLASNFHEGFQSLASGSADKTIQLWTASDDVFTLRGHTSGVISVSFSADGQTLASGSADKTIRLWNATTGVHLKTLRGHTGGVNSVAFSPDGDTLASGSADKTIRLWELTRVPPASPPLNVSAEAIPAETTLFSNYPNPFNPETWIPYQLATPADVTLTIHDIHGRVVRILDLGHRRGGIYHNRSRAAYWDGRNAQGELVASGVYFYTLKAGDFTATRKMLIRK